MSSWKVRKYPKLVDNHRGTPESSSFEWLFCFLMPTCRSLSENGMCAHDKLTFPAGCFMYVMNGAAVWSRGSACVVAAPRAFYRPSVHEAAAHEVHEAIHSLLYRTNYSKGVGVQGPVSIQRPSFPGMGIPVVKIRRSWDRLIFNMGIPIYW